MKDTHTGHWHVGPVHNCSASLKSEILVRVLILFVTYPLNKISNSFSFSGETLSEEDAQNSQVAKKAIARFGCLPLVYSRRGLVS